MIVTRRNLLQIFISAIVRSSSPPVDASCYYDKRVIRVLREQLRLPAIIPRRKEDQY